MQHSVVPGRSGRGRGAAIAGGLATALLVAACGGAATTPTPPPATIPPATIPPATAPATQAATAVAASPATGPAGITAPSTVAAGTEFEVAWTGPDGPGDYVTIVKAGVTAWSNESYFNTSAGNPGRLHAPIEGGAYEVWYVLGTTDVIGARTPITVTPASVSVTAPETAAAGSTFDVAWTGPDGPGDFITIVAAGAPETAYLGYCYTSQGPTCKLTAPDAGGPYEVRYVTQAYRVLASRPIEIR